MSENDTPAPDDASGAPPQAPREAAPLDPVKTAESSSAESSTSSATPPLEAPATPAVSPPEVSPEVAARTARAVEFAQALVHEDDIPAVAIRVHSFAVVVVAPNAVDRDKLQAAVFLAPSRDRFRDVPVAGLLDPAIEIRFEREDPALVVAREKLWRILRQLDDEIEQALSASSSTPKDAPGFRPAKDFIGRLRGVREQIARHHGLCYSNTLMESHDRIKVIVRRAVHVARSAGIKVAFEE